MLLASLSWEIQEEEQVLGKVSLVLHLLIARVLKAAQRSNGYGGLELM